MRLGKLRQMDQFNHNPSLDSLIVQQIVEGFSQKISFARFMDLALYHPQWGYYAANRLKIGAAGDFVTAPHLGADFGELLAEQFIQMWQMLDRPSPFTLVEMGAGQGILAGDILRYLQSTCPQLWQSLDYVIVERAAVLIQEQRSQLGDLLHQDIRIDWKSLEQIPANSITGCFFSNELLDALPVHQVMRHSGQLQEIYVTSQPDAAGAIQFAEVIGELSTPDLVAYFQNIGIDLTSSAYPEGYRTEVNLAALDWLQTVGDRLHRGYVLTIDYGYPATRYYHPNRTEGTLQCYYRHRHHSNPYLQVGQQDITAHVDFTALEKQGERCGLETVGLTKQGLFLMALGLGDRIARLAQTEAQTPQQLIAVLQRRDALQSLINPLGLGNFGVLIQSKQVETAEILKGLQGEGLQAWRGA